jgi:hypothetical protein
MAVEGNCVPVDTIRKFSYLLRLPQLPYHVESTMS